MDLSVALAGRIRIAAHLTEAVGQTTLWSDRFDRTLEDTFALQDEISEAIAEALDTAFFPKKVAAVDPAAYDLYLRARVISPDPEQQAGDVATLERVTAMAPQFAEGWALLSSGRQVMSMLTPYSGRRPLVAQAALALGRALALDPDNADGAATQWLLCDPFGAYLAQEVSARRMREIGQNAPLAQFTLAYHLEGVGRMREAVEFARRARDLDPKNSNCSALYGQNLWRAGRFAEGIAAMEAHAQIWPDDHHTAAVRILAYAHQQDWAKVDAMLEPQRLGQYPLREHSLIIGLVALLRSPDPASRRLVLEMMRGRTETSGHLDPVAMVWPSVVGFTDEALDILDGAKLGPSGSPDDTMGVNAYRSHMVFPAAYPELRANPRFVKMCARLGLVEYWLETKTWPDCADEVPYDFRTECEKHRDYPKDTFFTG